MASTSERTKNAGETVSSRRARRGGGRCAGDGTGGGGATGIDDGDAAADDALFGAEGTSKLRRSATLVRRAKWYGLPASSWSDTVMTHAVAQVDADGRPP